MALWVIYPINPVTIKKKQPVKKSEWNPNRYFIDPQTYLNKLVEQNQPTEKHKGKQTLIGVAVSVVLLLAFGTYDGWFSGDGGNNNVSATQSPTTQSVSLLNQTQLVASPQPNVPTAQSNLSEQTTTANEKDYVLPYSSIRELKDNDLRSLTKNELRLARNEIYARYGRVFRDETLQKYFDSKSWYKKLSKLPLGTEPTLTKLERSNIELIQVYEARQ